MAQSQVAPPLRVALVTGAARGIGRAIAWRLAEQGRRVAVGDRLEALASSTATDIRNAGGDAISVYLDVTDGASVDGAVRQIAKDLGPVDIVVSCAGWDEQMAFVDTDEDFWLKVVEINYLGVLRITKSVLPGMVDRGWGRVVNIGSDAGRVGSTFEAVYSGAKGGVIAFSKALAREVARNGVTVNTVCPGPTQTPLLEHMLESNSDAPKLIAAMTRAIPMKRLGQPEDIAEAVSFFSAEESRYITGQTLSVSGGLTMA